MAINLSDSIQTITSPVQSIIGGDLVLIGWRKEMLSWTWTGCQPGCSTVVWTTPRPPEPLSPVSCCTQRLQLGSAEHCGSVREAQGTKEHTGTTCTMQTQAGCRKAALLLPLHLCANHVAAGSLLSRALGRGLVRGDKRRLGHALQRRWACRLLLSASQGERYARATQC